MTLKACFILLCVVCSVVFNIYVEQFIIINYTFRYYVRSDKNNNYVSNKLRLPSY